MATRNEIIRIDETTEMLFKDEEAKKIWNDFVKTYSKDYYSKSCITYARRWAKYMQNLITGGKTVADIAERSSDECDIEGITGFVYLYAFSILVECWKYGEELLQWHNKKYGY